MRGDLYDTDHSSGHIAPRRSRSVTVVDYWCPDHRVEDPCSALPRLAVLTDDAMDDLLVLCSLDNPLECVLGTSAPSRRVQVCEPRPGSAPIPPESRRVAEIDAGSAGTLPAVAGAVRPRSTVQKAPDDVEELRLAAPLATLSAGSVSATSVDTVKRWRARRAAIASIVVWRGPLPLPCDDCGEPVERWGKRSRGGMVHHIDNDMANNNPANTQVLHAACRARQEARTSAGDPLQMVDRECAECSITFRVRPSSEELYCSRRCKGDAQAHGHIRAQGDWGWGDWPFHADGE